MQRTESAVICDGSKKVNHKDRIILDLVLARIRPYIFIIVLLLFILYISSAVFAACAECSLAWKEKKGKHFIIQYSSDISSSWATRLLRNAENYYNKIASQIGYTRYKDFWTWDKRTKIIVYPDSKTFSDITGQPIWSRGGAVKGERLSHGRIIVTYKQEQGFLDGVLPHEISHLTLRDFIGPARNIPVWLDEGLAQLQEKDKVALADRIVCEALKQGYGHIPFSEFMNMDFRYEGMDKERIRLFYAQSLSVVSFLIRHYGTDAFGRLCRGLRDGMDCVHALKKAYPMVFDSPDMLEAKWLGNLRRTVCP